jgi:Family of unknown function (DUF6491)
MDNGRIPQGTEVAMTLNSNPYRRRIAFAGLGAGLLALAGCATNPSAGGGATADRGSPVASDCIFSSGVRDYATLDDRNLILYGPGRRAYHVVLAMPSFDLEHEYQIGILDRDGRICPFGGDAIIVQGAIPERIPIRSIEAISNDEVMALKVRFGKEEAAPEDLVTVTDIDPDDG